MTPRRILIVDDEPLIGMMLSDWLSELGHEVVGPALSVREALRLVDGDRLDGAILDVTLGNETCYAIAEVLERRSVPLIFATGHRSERIDPRYRTAPILQKPFDQLSLQKLVSTLPVHA